MGKVFIDNNIFDMLELINRNVSSAFLKLSPMIFAGER